MGSLAQAMDDSTSTYLFDLTSHAAGYQFPPAKRPKQSQASHNIFFVPYHTIAVLDLTSYSATWSLGRPFPEHAHGPRRNGSEGGGG